MNLVKCQDETESALADSHELRQGFIPPNPRAGWKTRKRLKYERKIYSVIHAS